MKIYSVAIIGGGFSGMCCASMLVERGVLPESVAVLEGAKRLGKKILATGNGRGNITNACVSPEFYHGSRGFAAAALSRYSNAELKNFFSSLGLITDEENGRIYPASFCASAVCDVLRFSLEERKINVFTEFYVSKLGFNKQTGAFAIRSDSGNEVYAEKVVLATGGKSGSGFLTDGKSYSLALGFGHKLTELSPSLVQIKTEREFLKGLKGVKQEGVLSLFGSLKKGGEERFIKSFSGDVLFCDYGISGNAAFSLSAYLKGVYSPTLKIELLPSFSKSELLKLLLTAAESLKQKNGGVTVERVLLSVLPARLSAAIIKRAGLTPNSAATQSAVSAVNGLIKGLLLKIEGTLGFDAAQVTAGGIATEAVGSDMQSKLKSGLYIIGEALDVDGDCGGYNLQWAFTSAAVCAEEIAKTING